MIGAGPEALHLLAFPVLRCRREDPQVCLPRPIPEFSSGRAFDDSGRISRYGFSGDSHNGQ